MIVHHTFKGTQNSLSIPLMFSGSDRLPTIVTFLFSSLFSSQFPNPSFCTSCFLFSLSTPKTLYSPFHFFHFDPSFCQRKKRPPSQNPQFFFPDHPNPQRSLIDLLHLLLFAKKAPRNLVSFKKLHSELGLEQVQDCPPTHPSLGCASGLLVPNDSGPHCYPLLPP